MANTKNRIQVTLLVRPVVWARFKEICENSNVSYSHGMERGLIEIINHGKVPGIEPIEIEQGSPTNDELREGEKYGEAAVPVLDADAIRGPKD